MPRILPAGLALLLATPLSAQTAPTETAPRYTLREAQAELTPASADGRFQVRADVRLSDAAKSLDSRWQLQSTTATCEPFADPIFRNGFEPAQ